MAQSHKSTGIQGSKQGGQGSGSVVTKKTGKTGRPGGTNTGLGKAATDRAVPGPTSEKTKIRRKDAPVDRTASGKP
jgi:hypothetical protein